jgi:hypothetical protein
MNLKIDNNKFFPWFAGFCDAECSFIRNITPIFNKNKDIINYRILYKIQIGLSIKDKALIELINNKLGEIGKIYNYPIKQESCLCIYSKESISKIFEIFFNKYSLLTSYQATRLEQLKIGVINKIYKISSPEEFKNSIIKTIQPNFYDYSENFLDYWLTGFLNGEVSFTTFKGKAGNKKPQVSLEHTNEKAVNFFRDYLNLNPKIYSRQRDTRKRTYVLNINSVKDLNTIINFLNKTNCLLGNKSIQFEKWKAEYFNY